jgi:hypothetical protein
MSPAIPLTGIGGRDDTPASQVWVATPMYRIPIGTTQLTSRTISHSPVPPQLAAIPLKRAAAESVSTTTNVTSDIDPLASVSN